MEKGLKWCRSDVMDRAGVMSWREVWSVFEGDVMERGHE